MRVVYAPPQLKQCSLCHEYLPLSEFGVDRSRRDGLAYEDLVCARLYRAERRAHNEQPAAYNRSYYQAHRASILRRAAERYREGKR